ncbi:dienelactone hydrolase family protein [Nocardia bovistercoris]|uniref:Dienelactone hydrolase family protein n=1 Tax=Nocardia bovistercoris TaxID=2785916 RepID=A0A931N229_9NOCA|nr:dienelactone hydrolase family protein [Nocardia bovistercoris]MBH0775581.1 dienelactone hydrolase family protein [Nocardia bovistercoris]
MTLSVAFHTLDVPTPDGDADAYLAHPDDGRAHPGVLFLMDAFGLRPWLREMVETVAAHGCTVLAPNLFHRSGPSPVLAVPDFSEPDARAKFFADLAPIRATLTPDLALRDTGAYLNWLTDSELVTPGGFGVVGYCLGGRLTLRVAGEYGPAIAAAASFHGGGLAQADHPDSPHHRADRIEAELFIAHASNDPSMPQEQIEVLDKTLEAAGTRFTSVTYPDAAHGFTMRDMPIFRQDAYDRHLHDLFALFDRNLPFDPA